MVDVTEYLSQNVTIDFVQQSPSRKLVIVSAGAGEVMQDGKKKLKFLTEIDGKQRHWIPNKQSLGNLAKAFGTNTEQWIGKAVDLGIGTINGKQAVVGQPVTEDFKPTNNI